MLQGPAGKVALEAILPPKLRKPDRIWDKKETNQLLTELEKDYPDLYAQVADYLVDLGRMGATYSTGFSFGISDLEPAPELKKFEEQVKRLIAEKVTRTLPQYQSKEFAPLVAKIADQIFDSVQKRLREQKHPTYVIYEAGVRGSPVTLKRLHYTEGTAVDASGNLIPYPILHSFPQGLDPAEYWAVGYGSKQGIVLTKLAPADAGTIYKQLAQAAHELIITKSKGPNVGIKRALPVKTDDEDNVGAILAEDVGGYRAGTVITPDVLERLRAKKIDEILVYSPIAGGPRVGLYAIQAGVRNGSLPAPGTLIGLLAAQAIGERVSQMSVGKKHQGQIRGGIASATEIIEKFISVPKAFGGAIHAQSTGRITKIVPTDIGYKVYIGDKEHFIPKEQELAVKVGDKVEAGDMLSNGLPNPQEFARHKGIGEARRLFTEHFTQQLREMGFNVHRRNVEVIARALIDYVQLTEKFGENYPEEIVRYTDIEHSWKPRPGTKLLSLKQAEGKYLELPVLHFTIGTPITPHVIATLEKHNIKQIPVNDKPPPFQPLIIRALELITKDPDWLVRLLGAYQKRSLLDAVAEGAVSEKYKNPSFVPALAEGIEFGKKWPRYIIEP